MVDHPLPVVYCQVGFGEELRSDVEGLILYLGASAQDYEYYETPCMLYTRGLCDTLYSPTHIPCLPTAVAHWAWALIPPA